MCTVVPFASFEIEKCERLKGFYAPERKAKWSPPRIGKHHRHSRSRRSRRAGKLKHFAFSICPKVNFLKSQVLLNFEMLNQSNWLTLDNTNIFDRFNTVYVFKLKEIFDIFDYTNGMKF